MKKIISLALSLAATLSYACAAQADTRPSSSHEVFFAGSDYELNVYYVKGRQDGKTLLLIGGIQGDEPGGYLSADLYPDLVLEKGNLIVVPRANLKSIILGDRGPDGDMNRQFHDNAKVGPMYQVVGKLKELMSQADLFLHLHDGWGYHSPVYVDSLRNPNRYGQSLIADSANFTCDNGSVLPLQEMADSVLGEVNSRISNEQHHLHFFNTRTADPDTPYSEMRKTATYYALRKECLPAFGVEASKNLPSLEDKILYHNLVINAFMERLGIVAEAPRILIPTSGLHYTEVMVNGVPHMLKDKDTLTIRRNDEVQVVDIGTDYKRGVTMDLLGYGNLNDFKQSFRVGKDTQMVFRKEGQKFGSIDIKALSDEQYARYADKQKQEQHDHRQNVTRVFVVAVNDKHHVLLSGDTLRLAPADRLELISSFGDGSNDETVTLNFRGWVPETPSKMPNDDRGYLIEPDKSRLLRQYSEHGEGKRYAVVATDSRGNPVGEIWVQLSQ